MSGVVLKATDIYKSFGNNEVLKGISLDAYKGDVISILGSSGSGKSTFLRCMNLLEIPTLGSVEIHGETVAMQAKKGGGMKLKDRRQVERLRQHLSMVFQSFNLWSHMTIEENIMEAPVHVLKLSKAEAKERAEHYMEKVGIIPRRNYYPTQLSGGQQQRAAIARGLAMEPEALLFDEPTSALDPELIGEVLKVMRSLAEEGRTMLVVTHEMSFARDVSNKVIFLHQGQIDAAGAPSELFANPSSERFANFISSGY